MPHFAFFLLFIAFFRFGRRRHRWHRDYAYFPQPAAIPVELPKETAFDALKRRYVNGELSDERYQDELDKLLKTPEGRSQIQ